MEHKYVEHKNCHRSHCEICHGDLSYCSICCLWEGSLTTECPGEDSWEHQGAVYQGQEDFREGRWQPGVVSIHSPEYRRKQIRGVSNGKEKQSEDQEKMAT